MAFYAGKIIQHPAMANPTLVIVCDRNDLDDQLFSTFATCSHLLRQTPTQAEDTEHVQELLKVASGGVIFTTLQKFQPERREKYPPLSARQNIIVIVDEAHCSQYGLKSRVVNNKPVGARHAVPLLSCWNKRSRCVKIGRSEGKRRRLRKAHCPESLRTRYALA